MSNLLSKINGHNKNNGLAGLRPYLLVLLLGVMGLHGCAPRRAAIPVHEPDIPAAPVILSGMHARQAQFDFYAVRYSGSASLDGQTYSVSGQIRIQKDSAILISVSPLLGIEMARLLIRPDTLVFVNRLEGAYFVGDIGFVNRMLGTELDFYMLQSILLGNDLMHFNRDNFEVSVDRDNYLLFSPMRYASLLQPDQTRQEGRRPGFLSRQAASGQPSEGGGMEHRMWLNRTNLRLERMMLYDALHNRSIQARYTAWTELQGQPFPLEMRLNFLDSFTRADLDIRLSRAQLNQPQSMTLSIPDRYVPMDF